MTDLRPSKIIGIGRNYVEHAKELGNPMPPVPIIFFKPPTALIGNGDTILLPGVSQRVEFEAEIGVVIGRRTWNVAPAKAEEAIGGFTCVNDVTCRDLQKVDGQWGRAKGFDTFCPVGPRVAQGLDWRSLQLICRVNGSERQRASSTDMHFSIPELVSFVSGIMTLEPGDLIATGTPAGTAALADGDVVEVEIPGVGVLRNPVRNGETR
ncbi:MAG: fumarylacetoacetate hydrolase family protein [Gemmatimonadales bacterium]|jgi:2-keto-4-pentenoate hydratase/2-oxohepta-3-ene-1,7-dioic acid hydratase in catechol pathway